MPEFSKGPDEIHWQSIRLFVISHVASFSCERDLLLNKVIPDLQEWCHSRRINLIECSLRLGQIASKDQFSSPFIEASLKELDSHAPHLIINLSSNNCCSFDSNRSFYAHVSGEIDDSFHQTELQLLKVAFKNSNPNVFHLIRDDSAMSSTEREVEGISHYPVVIKNCDESIVGLPSDQIHLYRTSVNSANHHEPSDKDSFCKSVLEFFIERFIKIFPDVESRSDVINSDVDISLKHEAFMKYTAGQVVGRDLFIEELLLPNVDKESDDPGGMVIFGNSGAGKSAIMSALADHCYSNPKRFKKSWQVFFHFVGSVPGSTDLMAMLNRLMNQLKVTNDDNAKQPAKLEEVMALVRSALSNPCSQNFIIIVDAINQFDDIQDSSAPIAWLPVNVSPNIRIFISATPESKQFGLLRNLLVNWKFIQLQPLARLTKFHIIESQLARLNENIDSVQMELLVNKKSSGNPMWLSLATEELRSLHTNKAITSKIRNLPEDLFELEEAILARLEKDVNLGGYAVATVCLLECSVRGLQEHEIIELLSLPNVLPDNFCIAIKEDYEDVELIWPKICSILRPVIRFYGNWEDGRFDFYHRSLSKAVQRRYLSNSNQNFVLFHQRLADYFLNSPSISLARKIEEYPQHAWRCADSNGLIDFLSDWQVFDAMYDSEFSRQLSRTWALVFSLLSSHRIESHQPGNLEGIYDKMEKTYEDAVNEMISSKCDLNLIIGRAEKVARVFTQNGRFDAALKLANILIEKTKNLLESEEKLVLADKANMKEAKLRHAGFVFFKSEILDELMRSVDYILTSHLPRIMVLVDGFERALDVIKELAPSDPRLGRGYNRLAFHYAGIAARGGTETVSTSLAKELAVKFVEEAIDFYTRLGDQQVNLADCYITRGVCEGTSNDTQKEFYLRGLNLIIEHAGLFHPLLDRAYLNVGIYFEEAGELEQAYTYFRKWNQLLMTIYGAGHPRSQRSIRILNEDTYKQMAVIYGHQVPVVTSEMLANDAEIDEDNIEDVGG